MSYVRGLSISHTTYPNFGKLVSDLFQRIISLLPHRSIHIVFDSYQEKSLKESTRNSRSNSPMEILKIDNLTPIPKQMDKFWSSSKNKELLQCYVRFNFAQLIKETKQELVLSGFQVNGEQQPCLLLSDANQHEENSIDYLKCDIEEADQRLIRHLNWAAKNGIKHFTVISNDTDVMVLLIHYLKHFQTLGVEQIWQRVGLGSNRRLTPIHKIFERLPKPLRKVLLASYIGTGCDYLSKIGTKLGCLAALPEQYLSKFGTAQLDSNQIRLAEQYLVNVIKTNAEETTFDELRASHYNKHLEITQLPPTSHSVVHGHIARWWFLVKKLSSLLKTDSETLDPLEHGWKDEDGVLLPEKHLLLIPNHLIKICSCKGDKRCRTKRCSCRNQNVPCTSACGCKQACENI